MFDGAGIEPTFNLWRLSADYLVAQAAARKAMIPAYAGKCGKVLSRSRRTAPSLMHVPGWSFGISL
jgi:hypothetical protein